MLGVETHAVDVVLVLAAPFPRRRLAFDGVQVVTGEADLFAGDASVRPRAVVLRAADDAELIRPAADWAIVVQHPVLRCGWDAEALGHAGRKRVGVTELTDPNRRRRWRQLAADMRFSAVAWSATSLRRCLAVI